ncbi:reverse transcriptase domain-containing protein [Tanacetum coccineum]
MVPATTSLTGFSGETIWPLGQLRLLVTIGDAVHSTKAWVNFMIVRSLSPYNGIIGRPGIREIQAVPSTAHGMLKFPVDGGIVTIRSTISIPDECAMVITSSKEIPKKAGVRHENFKVALHPNFLDQEVAIGGTLSAKGRTELCSLLKENLDIFAWQPSDMTGVQRSIAEHRLNIREGYSPVRQKKRGQTLERAKAIQMEVHKLVEAGIMREVYYHEWLSNPVMVKKHHGNWRMCVDFMKLNKACPQDCYPLPEIDWKVESLYGYPFKCFLDAYKGYHQIQMVESDEEKKAFHTRHGVYCYTKMPFGLKNADATYQRLVDKAFDSQVGRNIEVYIDDLVIKSHTEEKMLRDIDETFHTLRKINMKLNPKKCTFGAVEGIFLGYMISPEGIKPCPDKTEVVLQLPSLRTIKEVQGLNGKLASLNRFLSKSAEKSLPLFKTLKKCIKKSDFHWTPDAKQAFKQLKQHLSELPLLVAPKPKEELIVYLFASHGKASSITGFCRQEVAKILPSASYCTDFLVEKPDESPPDTSVVETPQDPWTLFTDGSSCVDRSGAGLTQTSPEGRKFTYALRFQFTSSNNEAEYEALIAGLRIATQMGLRNVHEGVLYRQSFLKPWLRCDGPLQADYVIREIHERKGQNFDSRCGLFHKVDKGESRVDNHWQSGEEVRVGQHSVSLQSPRRNTVIPVEIGMPKYRTTAVDAVHNDEELWLNLDLLEERRERATIREAKAKLQMTKYYNSRVRGVTFSPGDFVYRSNDASHDVAGGKLGPKWEGPYEVTKALGDGAYRLRSMDGTILPRMWNIANFKKCYL